MEQYHMKFVEKSHYMYFKLAVSIGKWSAASESFVEHGDTTVI